MEKTVLHMNLSENGYDIIMEKGALKKASEYLYSVSHASSNLNSFLMLLIVDQISSIIVVLLFSLMYPYFPPMYVTFV